MGAALGGGLVFLGFCLVFSAFIIMSVRIYATRPDFVMKILRYAMISIFWAGFSIAAIAIGIRIESRHQDSYTKNMASVRQIWGGNLEQSPPSLTYETMGTREYENKTTGAIQVQKTTVEEQIGFESQALDIKLIQNIRKKGLLIFPGFNLEFSANYIFSNPTEKVSKLFFRMRLPTGAGNVNNIEVTLDGKPYTGDTNFVDGIDWSGTMNPKETHTISIKYKSQGTRYFQYSLGGQQSEVKKLRASLWTNYEIYKIPDGSMVPAKQDSESGNSLLVWEGENLVTGQNIALELDVKGNYGEVASKLFLYSPFSLFLFVASILLFSAAKEISLHPMHYLFIIASFFVFYLLGSYLMSYIEVIYGIFLSLFVSSGILIYYSSLIGKGKTFLNSILVSVVIFQWFFSIAFFFPEHTGLLITLASIAAFVLLLKYTAETDWENKF